MEKGKVTLFVGNVAMQTSGTIHELEQVEPILDGWFVS